MPNGKPPQQQIPSQGPPPQQPYYPPYTFPERYRWVTLEPPSGMHGEEVFPPSGKPPYIKIIRVTPEPKATGFYGEEVLPGHVPSHVTVEKPRGIRIRHSLLEKPIFVPYVTKKQTLANVKEVQNYIKFLGEFGRYEFPPEKFGAYGIITAKLKTLNEKLLQKYKEQQEEFEWFVKYPASIEWKKQYLQRPGVAGEPWAVAATKWLHGYELESKRFESFEDYVSWFMHARGSRVPSEQETQWLQYAFENWDTFAYEQQLLISGKWKEESYLEPLRKFYESKQFYTKLGYPQYGGKYSVFEIPEGYKVESLKEASEGLQIQLATQQQQWTTGGEAIPITTEDVLIGGAFLGGLVALPTLVASLGWKTVAVSIGLNVGVSEGVKYALTGEHLTGKETALAISTGIILPAVSAATFSAVGIAAPKIVSSPLGRIAVTTGLGTGAAYVLSGGDVKVAMYGGLISLAASSVGELVIRPAYHTLKVKLGKTTMLTKGEPTIGAGGEPVETYVSSTMRELGDRQLRIVASVTEKPVGYYGVTLESLVEEYTGQFVPTAHATLNLTEFSITSGGETLLTGSAMGAKGWRLTQQMFHFYSAPGSEQYVTAYGGYIGVGSSYLETPKVVFGGKPGLLVTLQTEVSPELLPKHGESVEQFLERFSFASGKTGISPETALGISSERQLSTPASYVRFGEQLPGTKFLSEGKIGTFTVKITPKWAENIPILRTMLSEYREVDVVVGKFLPVEAYTAVPKTARVAPLSSLKTEPTIFISKTSLAPSLFSQFALSPTMTPSRLSSVSKTSETSMSQLASQYKLPSTASFSPQKISVPTLPSSPFSGSPSTFSLPSPPLYTSKIPSTQPSMPHYTYKPSISVMPSLYKITYSTPQYPSIFSSPPPAWSLPKTLFRMPRAEKRGKRGEKYYSKFLRDFPYKSATQLYRELFGK